MEKSVAFFLWDIIYYIARYIFLGGGMKRLIGFIFFWIAVGMAIMIFLPNEALGILVIFVLLLLGYNLFCC